MLFHLKIKKRLKYAQNQRANTIFVFSQKLTYLNTAFSLTFVEERIGCSLEEYAEKEKKHLSRKKRKAAWNPEVGERNSTDLTNSPRNEKEKT